MKLLICFISLFPCYSFSHSLQVKLKELKNEQGMIRYLLFNHSNGFPSEVARSYRSGSVKASEKLIKVSDLPAGTYALSIIHDENNNNKFDSTWGIPNEGFGFSNNPRVFFGPPGFEKTKFLLQTDTMIKIRMKYL